MRGRVLLAVLALGALYAAPARATTYRVGVEMDECTDSASAASAFSAARQDAGADTILLGRLTESGTFTDAPGRPVRVIGLGATGTVLRAASSSPALRLQDARSTVTELRLEGGSGPALQLDAGGSVRSSVVAGVVSVRGGNAELGSIVASGVQASCATSSATLALTSVTVSGTGPAGVSAACGTANRSVAIRASNTVVWGFTRGFALGDASTLSAEYSDFPEASGATNLAADPQFTGPGDLRPAPGSHLVDAGRAGLLTDIEPHEDALGYVRVSDGNGDGVLRRDIGALELQPPAPTAPPGNVLSNPGAEAGTPATDDTSSPAPPGWSRTGGFTFARYGSGPWQFPFPNRRVGEALGAGDAFFAAGPGRGGGSATQIADVSGAAPEIDRELASVSLSALLGGYLGSSDDPVVDAVFRGPTGRRLGALSIGPVTAEQRARASTLLPRAAAARIPALTRTIVVTMRSTPPAGTYDDAYFDAVALVPTVGGRPARRSRHPGGSGKRRVRPYAGLQLLSSRVAIDSHGRARAHVACPSRTIGKCRGVITLASRLGKRSERRIGHKRVAVLPGSILYVYVPLRAAARRVAGKRKLAGHLYAATRDRQGVTRTSTSPVRVVRGRLDRR